MLKQLEPKVEKIGDVTYYIKPFPALKAANISAELASTLTPLFAALIPLAGENDIMNVDASAAAASIATCVSFDGDNFEKLVKKLLVGEHIFVKYTDEYENLHQEALDTDTLNEIFCGEVQDMFILCFYVIRTNFKGFFKKFANLSGKGTVADILEKKLKNTENLMSSNLASLS